MRTDPDFLAQISYLDLNYLTHCKDVIYIVDAQLKLRAYNIAWEEFAQNNNGDTVLESYAFGKKVTSAGEEPIKTFITEAYQDALFKNKPFSQCYECSSSEKRRVFHQTAYPLIDSKGLVISHHLVVEEPHSAEAIEFQKKFQNEYGFITQCANCRKVRDPEDESSWLWIPSLVNNPFADISHGLCRPCLAHYYPEINGID